MYVNFVCPPLPHLIWSGTAQYRSGDSHEKRVLSQTFDLIVVQSGRLYLQEEDRKYVLESGDYLILNSDMSHKGYQCCEGDTCFYWTHFYTFGDYTITESLPKMRPTRFHMSKLYKSEPFYLSILQYGSIGSLNFPSFEKQLQTLSQFEVNRFRATAHSTEATLTQLDLQRIFLRIIASISNFNPAQENKPTIANRIWEHLNEHYADPFNLKSLAQEYNFHPGYIIRSVKKQYGLSPLQLVLSIRIEKAKLLLESEEYSVQRVAELVGFGNATYFSRQFRRLTGQSPSEYQQQAKGFRQKLFLQGEKRQESILPNL